MGNENLIDYDTLLKESMYYVIREVLKKVAKHGLCGDHYFYISYITNHKKVEMPSSLRKKYPDKTRIVIQYNFKDLAVFDEYFQVTLSFNNKYVKLVIPFEAITSFSDPSKMFMLEPKEDFDDMYGRGYPSYMGQEDELESTISNHIVSSDNIIYLDAFRQSRKTPASFKNE